MNSWNEQSLIKGEIWPQIQFRQTKRKFGNVFAGRPWRCLNNGPHTIIHHKEWAAFGTNPFSPRRCLFVFGSRLAVIIHNPGCGSVTLPAVMYETVAHWAQKRRRLYWEFRSTCANMMDDPMGNSSSGQFLKKKKWWEASGQLHPIPKGWIISIKIVNVGAQWKPSTHNWPLNLWTFSSTFLLFPSSSTFITFWSLLSFRLMDGALQNSCSLTLFCCL